MGEPEVLGGNSVEVVATAETVETVEAGEEIKTIKMGSEVAGEMAAVVATADMVGREEMAE